ncbi:MAG: hypothetical protein ACU85E_16435 [Gammaproteobacteria bacterium]
MVNASRESINKQIKIWEQNGLLSHEQGILTIKNENTIHEIASIENE